jgi:ribose 5-phosphate isomerase B
MKERLKKYLSRRGILYEDVGVHSPEPADYPGYALKVATRVAKHKNARGVLVCGTGTGMAIAANKIRGIRAAVAYDTYSARMSRHDNDANVLGLRGRFFPYEKARKILAVWLKTPFSGERKHKRRLQTIKELDR